MQQQMQMMQQMQSQQQMHFSQSPKKAQELEAGLNVLRNDYKREQLTLRKDEEYDPIEAQEIKSSASTKTIQEEKDQDEYLTKSQRLFVLEFFTISALRSMHNWKGRTPIGSNKRDLLMTAVPLIKTKTQLIDFILSACPDEI